MILVASVCLSLHKQSSSDVVCINFLLETDNLSLNFLMEFSKLLSCEWRVHSWAIRRNCEVFKIWKIKKVKHGIETSGMYQFVRDLNQACANS